VPGKSLPRSLAYLVGDLLQSQQRTHESPEHQRQNNDSELLENMCERRLQIYHRQPQSIKNREYSQQDLNQSLLPGRQCAWPPEADHSSNHDPSSIQNCAQHHPAKSLHSQASPVEGFPAASSCLPVSLSASASFSVCLPSSAAHPKLLSA